MPKEHVAIFALLCIIAFGAGYWHSSPKVDSGERAEVVAPPAPTIITNVVTNTLKEVVTNIVTAPQPTPVPTPPTVKPRPTPTPAPVKPQPTNIVPATQKDEKGFKSIFNGKDLNGWAGPVQNYLVVDGTIQCKPGKGGTIYTKEVYGDFVVRLEIKLPAGGNNGLAIRYPGNGDPSYVGMCELQVLDNNSPKYAKLHPTQYHGSAYGMVAAKRGHLKKPGEWNMQEVTVKGFAIKVVLNGETILDCDLSKVENPMRKIGEYKGRTRKEGHFGFAGHSDPVQFRNVNIKRLN